MNENKYAVMLAQVILIMTLTIFTVLFPPIIIIGIVGWAGWTLWKNYNE
tara:strand:+ start:1790 stop:1936 length:147 start_codon:yes stop_codon:yes gene_type:complete